MSDTAVEAMISIDDLGIPDPFKRPVAEVDPLTKIKVDRVLIGPVYAAKRGADFDYFRYVTFYNVTTRKERIYQLPVHREECFDKSDLFANYSWSYTFSAKVSAGVQVGPVGLSTELTQTRTLTTSRNIRATGKVVADHTPYLYKSSWSGFTYLQTYTAKTRAETLVTQQDNKTKWWVQFLFPTLSMPKKYPMEFDVQDAEWTFVVERKILSKCPDDN
ncbi:MAG: hypothetical protein JST80_01230 [Bdellovibrionales bacterium]|nr:hypothetical protein [Bdellovibrionales bacterium]